MSAVKNKLLVRKKAFRKSEYIERKVFSGFPTDCFTIDPFSSISAAHAAGALPSFVGPKRRKQEKGLESLECPLRSQNAIPAPYVKLPQKGPDSCDTVGIPSGPF